MRLEAEKIQFIKKMCLDLFDTGLDALKPSAADMQEALTFLIRK